jgi:DNA-binding transcriptional LysR family regulator
VEVRHLATFLAVWRLGSFRRAADELGYAQSTVTGQIKSVESELGAELLDRSGNQVRLTGAGERLVPLAQQILDLVDAASSAVRDDGGPAGQVLVGSIESLITYRLSPVVELFHHRFPRMRLVVRPSLCPDTVRALRAGELDVGFLMSAESIHPGLTTVTLCTERFAVVAAPGHPLTRQREVSTSELRAATILTTEYGCPYRELFESALSEGSPEKVQMLEFGTIEAIKQMAASGLGATLLPRFAVAEELGTGELAAIDWPVPFTMFTQLAWRRGKWITTALRQFIDESSRALREDA